LTCVSTGIDVRHAQKSDVRALSTTLGRAFCDDPVMTWMVPDNGQRAKGLPRLFATMTRHHYLGGGGVEIATRGAEVGAATLWDPPGRWQQTRFEELLMLPTFMVAFGSRLQGGQRIADLMKERHPEEPHWYLFAIGSNPTVRGAGYGQAVMRSRLDRCDADHVPAYLENSNPRNESYYMRFGFEVTGEIKIPDGGPSLWPMWRAAR
jgi:ribosomal protein S18 acetylase RimI-like enzyme